MADFSLRRILKRVKPTPWLLPLSATGIKFCPWIIWGIGISFCLQIIGSETHFFSSDVIRLVRKVYAIIITSFAALSFKHSLEETLLKDASDVNSRAIIDVISRITSVVIITIASFMILDVFGVPLSALLAFGGLGGIAVSWAAKDVIANFFGGLMIYANRPFFVGDWIRSPNKNFEGVVEKIGWYMTQIRTFDRRPTYIPNAVITDAIVENPGRMYNRRIKTTVGLRYQDIDAVNDITKAIEEMLRGHADIDQEQFLMVHLLDFGPSSLEVQVYTFTKTTNWIRYREVQQDVLLKIGTIVKNHGAEIAFPTQTLHLSKSVAPSDTDVERSQLSPL